MRGSPNFSRRLTSISKIGATKTGYFRLPIVTKSVPGKFSKFACIVIEKGIEKLTRAECSDG